MTGEPRRLALETCPFLLLSPFFTLAQPGSQHGDQLDGIPT
jgi:hypothetical protein